MNRKETYNYDNETTGRWKSAYILDSAAGSDSSVGLWLCVVCQEGAVGKERHDRNGGFYRVRCRRVFACVETARIYLGENTP